MTQSEFSCESCEVHHCTFTPKFPIVTLGKCIKWDTEKCETGDYKAPEGSNVDVLADFVADDGRILWCSDCHGSTIVCMESVCQLKDALKNFFIVLKGSKLG